MKKCSLRDEGRLCGNKNRYTYVIKDFFKTGLLKCRADREMENMETFNLHLTTSIQHM
jgi:hypothetical protein